MERFKRILLVALALCMAVALVACGGAPANTETGADEPANTDTQTDLPANTDTGVTDTAGDGKVTYTVTVVDTAGNPIPGAMVQICKDTCLPTSTNEQGVATWTQPEDSYKVSFLMVPAGYTADAEEFYFEDGAYEMTITLTPAE